jgi:soluble lytic murein transglycosylase-like protein
MADQFDLKGLLDALIYAESGGDPMAVSDVGARGITQMMPDTAMDPRNNVRNVFERGADRGFDVSKRDEATAIGLLHDPEISYLMGDDYLRAMVDLFGGDMDRALAAYNWGPKRAAKWSGDFADLPEQSQDYIPKIRQKYEELMGEALPQRGTYGLQMVTSQRPVARPAGLLEDRR